MPAGYSGTPLVRKLGIKSGMRIAVIDAPKEYSELVADLPDDVEVGHGDAQPLDLIHIFVKSKAELQKRIGRFREQIRQNGMIWVSWPKRTSKVPTDVTEDVVRDVALRSGLVDVKVCAVDEVWSGLKLVIRKADRR